MDESLIGLMEILGPIVLLIVLLWLVIRRRSGSSDTTEAGTRDVYAEEEVRRREGTDDL